MHLSILSPLVLAVLATAQAFPLPTSAGNTTAQEGTAPFVLPLRCTQTKIVDRNSLVAAQAIPANCGTWDMVSFDPSSRYVFVPCERSTANMFRYDMQTGAVAVIISSNSAVRTADPASWTPVNDLYSRLDPAKWTPWNTVLTAEETIGGRLFEVVNPLASGGFQIEWRTSIPSVAHEGIGLDAAGNLYFVDENNSGSIYRFVPATPGDLSVGQTFVLSIDAYRTDPNARPAEAYDSVSNSQTVRNGAATWMALTDPAGVPLTVADPFAYVTTTGGRFAADEVMATPYGRPEDLTVATLANGNECLFVCITDEHQVLSIELTGGTSAMVRVCVDRSTTDLASGQPIGVDLAFPDNAAVDAWGNVWFGEDNLPGDFFRVIDDDRDGVAEAIGRMASLGVAGSEPSGYYFDRNDPYRYLVTVQHPSSGNDALWSIQTRPYPANGGEYLQLHAAVGGHLLVGPGSFVREPAAGSNLTLAVESPNGAVLGDTFAMIAQPFFTTGPLPVRVGPIWFGSLGLTLPLYSGVVQALPSQPPYGANAITVPVPPGLSGLSMVVQAVALPAGLLVAADAVEIVLP